VLESVRVVELAPARDIQQVISDLPIAVDEGGEEALSLTEAAVVIREKLDPKSILKLRVRALVKEAPSSAWTEDVPESMWVDPAFPAPTYSLLAKISTDFLLPGIGDVPDNTMALAKVNAAFIESFLLGANLELSREFIWREFPADLTDTWLRVFWDTAGATSEDGTPIEDIARVAEWSSGSLGTHQSGMDPERVLVLLIKGELLRRYPKTLVYAVPAKWQDTDSAGSERVEDTTKPPELPLFVGSLGDDVVFLGFQFDDEIDIDVDIRGTTNRTDEKPGWFFAFEQPPTEPRFGLDVGNAGQAGSKPTDWADVSWFHALGSADASATHAPIAQLDGHTCPYDDNDGSPNRWDETWGLSSKAMARITLQRPVRMLVHADQMLEPEEA
jgi:hypothetical protein